MCGVAGILDYTKPVQQSRLEKMVDRLHHRGPDGKGFFVDGNIGLGHARLSIIDLDTGEQPIHNENRDIWVVFNGEIFNYIELRKELYELGHIFYTKTDTEVIVHLYEQYGNDFVKFLNGQFSIAIWDMKNNKLILARDRVGITPLFYKQENGSVLFASEIKSINAAAKQSPEPNYQALDQLMTFWAPVGPNTMFKDVYEVSPGQLIEITKNEISKRQYWEWDFPVDGDYIKADLIELKQRLRELLVDATSIRLRADVPVGAYLSGGLDSSVLVSLIHNFSNSSLRTFSIGFSDSALDETSYQQEMIDYINATHSNIHCSGDDVAKIFEKVIWHTEMPILRAAPAPMSMLSGLVRSQGYKVVLTGEGSDEVLGGYDLFKEAKIRHFWSKNATSSLRPLLLKRLYPYLDLSSGQAYLQKFFGEALDNPDIPYFSHLPRWTTTAKTKEFFSRETNKKLHSDSLQIMQDALPLSLNKWHPFNRAQFIESKSLMSGYLLSSQGDRMLMSNSVEGRFPFLDHRIIEFVNGIHPKYKMKGLNEKYLLKETMRNDIPKSIVNRYKQPYRAPDIDSFLQNGKLGEVGQNYMNKERILKYEYFDAEKVNRLIKKIESGRAIGYKDNMAFMGILSTQIWHNHFIDSTK